MFKHKKVQEDVRVGSEVLALKLPIISKCQIFYKKFLAVPEGQLGDVLVKIY